MKLLNKNIQVPRGQNIGKAIIDSFPMYNKVEVATLNVVRDIQNRTNVVSLTYTYR